MYTTADNTQQKDFRQPPAESEKGNNHKTV